MVMSYGLDGNMGYNIADTEMNKDELYRHYAAVLFENATARKYYFEKMSRDSGFSKETRHHAWLCLMGLIETWDMIH